MKIVNRFLPFKGYTAMTIFPFLFVRKDRLPYLNRIVLRHEETHAFQQIETLILSLSMFGIAFGLQLISGYFTLLAPFVYFILYALEYIVKLPLCDFDFNRTYRSISSEQEAYAHELESEYNTYRKPFSWIVYIFKTVKV